MTASSAASPGGQGTDHQVLLTAPHTQDGARRSWCKLVRGVDRDRPGGFALRGDILDAGRAYEVSAGALLVAADAVGEHWHVRVLRAETGGAVEVKTWLQKNQIGPRIVDWVGRRLPAGPVHLHAAECERWQCNRYSGRCRECGGQVQARTGWQRREHGSWVILHDGPCPVRRNAYAGPCWDCSGWIAVGEGVLQLRSPRLGVARRRLRRCHAGECPVVPAARPDRCNEFRDWCLDCGEWVAPQQGVLRPGGVEHRDGQCPSATVAVPTWRIRRVGMPFVDGEVLRTRFTPQASRGEQPIPPAAPGYRLLDEEGFAEVIGVVLQQRSGVGARQYARVRVATPEEASGILVEDVQRAVQVRPYSGFMASWSAETIGPTGQQRQWQRQFGDTWGLRCAPWLAEVTGYDRRFGLRREFLPGKRDYSRANSRGTRGVWSHWSLRPNRVYEAYWKTSHETSRREFLRATAAGDVVFIEGQEVHAWLRYGAVWPDS